MTHPVLDARCVTAAITACATSSARTTCFKGVEAATRPRFQNIGPRLAVPPSIVMIVPVV
jgi:hypothetical protein